MIPKIIHQIYLRGDLPERLARNVEEIKAHNPGWEHCLWDDAKARRFIEQHFGKAMIEAYARINAEYGAARADFLRHLIIWQFGGVYLDIKTDAARPLDEVLQPEDEYVITQWSNGPGERDEGMGLHPCLSHIPGGEYQVNVIVARPRHPFSKAMIDRVVSNIASYGTLSGVGRNGVLRLTGPIAYSLALHPILHTAPYRLVKQEALGIGSSIADYDHFTVFAGHYSTLTSPLVRMTMAKRLIQKGVETLRALKQKLA